MKLSTYAKRIGVTYQTAYRHYCSGILKGRQLKTGTIIIEEDQIPKQAVQKVAIYCRVSSSQNKKNLESQKKRVTKFCRAKGWRVSKTVTEIGSGVNDTRKKWTALLKDLDYNIIVVEHKDRFTRFGFNIIKVMLETQNREIFVINESSSDKDDLLEDLVSIITSFCARIYGLRRCKRKTETLIKKLKQK